MELVPLVPLVPSERPLVSERPYFGKEQIRSSRELKIGDKVIPVHFNNVENSPVTIIGYFVNEIGKGFMIRNEYNRIEKMFHSDKGLLPYKPSGKWNPTNWLKKAK